MVNLCYRRSTCLVWGGSLKRISKIYKIKESPRHVAHCRCEVHVFDPTLTQDVQERVSSIEGVTFHNYGLGVADGEVSYELSDYHLEYFERKPLRIPQS